MGQEQSTEQQRSRPTSLRAPLTPQQQQQQRQRQLQQQRQSLQPPPYTSFSLDKQEQHRQQRRQQQQQQSQNNAQQRHPQQQQRQIQPSTTTTTRSGEQFVIAKQREQQKQQDRDGVVDVVKRDAQSPLSSSSSSSMNSSRTANAMKTNSSPLQQEVDEILEQLAMLPQFYPLIKSSVDQSLLRDLIQSTLLGSGKNKYSSIQELDSLDSRSLVELLAEFQTHAMHQCRDVCVRQDQVIRLIRHCQLKANECVMDLNKKADRMKKIASDLRDVDRLARYVDQSRLAVDSIVEQLQTLEHLLPSSVIKNIQTPLFNMEKILATPRMPTTSTTADSTGKDSLSSSTLVTPRMDGDAMSSPYAPSTTSDLQRSEEAEDKQHIVTDDNVTTEAAEEEGESEDADRSAENIEAEEGSPDPIPEALSTDENNTDPDPVMPSVEEENPAAPGEDTDG